MINFETIEVTTDLLIIGGGMAGCGAAIEAAHWAKKNNLKVVLVEKAAIERSGAVAQGLSALNQYVGMKVKGRTPADYVRYVRNDLMGVTREDLVYDIARHVDGSVHLLERWGLPIWKDDKENYVFEGPWQLMINGESYKSIVAEATKKSLATLGNDNIYERIFIVEPLIKDNKCVGALGFSVRENKFYIFKAKAVLLAMGGAVHVFRPRSTGEGIGRSWYPPFNTGSSTYFALKAGSEMTCQEVRFVPVRFKDAYGPVGAWFLLFQSIATTALGGNYMQERMSELGKWAPYGLSKPVPANLRNFLMMLDQKEGKGPAYMRTEDAIAKIISKLPDAKEQKKKLKEVESEAWEDFLDMTISQALLWASTNSAPDEKPSEIQACEPYFIGSHSGASGAWVSGPSDLSPSQYFWGYNRMATTEGIFCAGDAAGASSHKFSDGSFTEGRIAAKSALAYIADNPEPIEYDSLKLKEMQQGILKPLETYEKYSGQTDNPDVNENYIRPKNFLSRLQKIMDEYAGGASSGFTTNKPSLEKGLEYLEFLKEDSDKLAAEDHNELMRCWENIHRMWQAEAHVRTVLFREETRWPGYYFRADAPKMDDQNWKCFVNCRWDPQSNQWSVFKREIVKIID